MASTTCQIEEIPREDPSVPQIRLQIIHLDFNEQTQSLPAGVGSGGAGGALQQFAWKPVQLKRAHKLQSFDHLLKESATIDANSEVRRTPKRRRESRKTQTEECSEPKDQSKSNGVFHQEAEEESAYLVFVKGMNGILAANRTKVIGKLVHVLNNHAVSVATNEHKLFSRPRASSTKATLKHVCLRSGLLALTEALDDGGTDISRFGLVGGAQCLALTLLMNKNVASVGRNVWNSRAAQLLSDTWMSFGCVAAVVISAARE